MNKRFLVRVSLSAAIALAAFIAWALLSARDLQAVALGNPSSQSCTVQLEGRNTWNQLIRHKRVLVPHHTEFVRIPTNEFRAMIDGKSVSVFKESWGPWVVACGKPRKIVPGLRKDPLHGRLPE